MPAKLTAQASTGISNPKFVRFRRSDGAVWNTSGTPAFESYSAGNIANYGIAATETGATGYYTVTDPADTTEGDYLLVSAAGSSLAVTDLANNVQWTGEVNLPLKPTTQGRTLDVSAGGEAGVDWANVGSQTTTVNLSATTIASGGGGATAQQVWEYVSRTLTGSAGITVSSPVLEDGSVEIVAGAAYTATGAGVFTVTLTGYSGASLSGATAKIRFITAANYRLDGSSGAAVLEVSGSCTQSGSTVTATFSITSANTTTLGSTSTFPPDKAPNFQAYAFATPTSGVDVPLLLAPCTVKRAVAAVP